MSKTIEYTLRFDSNGNTVIDGIVDSSAKLQKSISRSQQVCEKFGAAFIKLEAVKRAIDGVASAFGEMAQPGLKLNSSMADLSAITGVTGEKLNEIEGYARKAAKTFGGSAAQGVEAYKLILSQLTPEIARSPEALAAMGNSVATLSKLMGGDAVSATEVLTTAMNQFQVSTNDPVAASGKMAEMMNVMAAAAKVGSAELPAIKAALENAGMAAKMAGVSFEETNAAIQVLDKAGKKGSEGGVALRNVLATLAEGRFLPKDTRDALTAAGVDIGVMSDKSLSLAQRLDPLKKVLGDSALMTKMFGKENQNAAMALISGRELMQDYTGAIIGTNTANEQAAVIMETTAEKMARMQARVDDLKIGIYGLIGAGYPYISMLTQTMSTIADFAPLVSLLTDTQKMKVIWDGIATASTWAWTKAQTMLNAAFLTSPIGWIVLGVAALTAGIVYAWNKFEGFRAVVLTVWETIKGFGEILKTFVIDRIKTIVSGLGLMGSAIYKLFTGDFRGAWSDARQGISDFSGASSIQRAITSGSELIGNIGDRYDYNLRQQKAWAKAQELMGQRSENGTITPAGIPGM